MISRRAFVLAGSVAHAANRSSAGLDEAINNEQLARISRSYYEGFLDLFPVDATQLTGSPRHAGELALDISPEHRARQRAFFETHRAAVAAIRRDVLNAGDRLNASLLAYEIDDRLATMDVPLHLMPIGPLFSLPVVLGSWASGAGAQLLVTEQDFEAFLRRISKLPAWLSQAVSNMEQGIQQDILLPRALVDSTLPQLRLLADRTASPFLDALKISGWVTTENATSFRKRYQEVLDRRVFPSLQALLAFMSDRYRAAARTTAGFGALPHGQAWYRALVRSSTTGKDSPDELHELGRQEMTRIMRELKTLQEQDRFAGSVQEYMVAVRRDARLMPFRSSEEVIQAYRNINRRIEAALPAIFKRRPRAGFDIRLVDALSRDTVSDNYVPPADDGSRPGVFYVVVQDPVKYSRLKMVSLLLHEGQPGHHFQTGIQKELSLPSFRRISWYDAYGEG